MSRTYDRSSFDNRVERRGTDAKKWDQYAGRDVLPFWIADMDFAAPDFVMDALRQRLEHPILGYSDSRERLTPAFQGWLEREFDWAIDAEWVAWIPGVVPGLNLAAQTLDRSGSILIPTPVYHPFLDIASNARLDEIRSPMVSDEVWQIDWQHMNDATRTDTRMLFVCNPQNPTGRCYTYDELAELASFVDKHDLLLVSDEIHCSIVLDETAKHIPIAGAFPEIAERTISLFAATKTYNIPGLSCAAAVIPDARLRKAFLDARAGLLPGIGPLEYVASEVAFNDSSNWTDALLDYLRENLRMVADVCGNRLAHLEGTYLAWIDVRDLAIDDMERYFERFGLGLSPGAQFGRDGYVRFNFACPQSLLQEGLDRLATVLNP
jgi:cystathionine beta-lyase